MKKNKKKLEGILNQEELRMLKGGGVRNKNTFSGCNCTYNNAASVSNINVYGTCSCTCTGEAATLEIY